VPHAPFVDINFGVSVFVGVGEEGLDLPLLDLGVGVAALKRPLELGVIDMGRGLAASFSPRVIRAKCILNLLALLFFSC